MLMKNVKIWVSELQNPWTDQRKICMAGMQQANAGNAMLSEYVVAEHRLVQNN